MSEPMRPPWRPPWRRAAGHAADPPEPTARSVAHVVHSTHPDSYGLVPRHRVVRRVAVVAGLTGGGTNGRRDAGVTVALFPLGAWAALCRAALDAPQPAARIARALTAHATPRVPFVVLRPDADAADPSVPRRERLASAAVRAAVRARSDAHLAQAAARRRGRGQLVGPDDTLLKVLPPDMLAPPGPSARPRARAWRAAWAAECAEAEAWAAANARAWPVRPGQLYLARAVRPDGRGVGPVTLGYSRDPANRVRKYAGGEVAVPPGTQAARAAGARVRLLAAVPGTAAEEEALHAHLALVERASVPFGVLAELAPEVAVGEWYRATPAVLTCLTDLLPAVRRAGTAAAARSPTARDHAAGPLVRHLRARTRDTAHHAASPATVHWTTLAPPGSRPRGGARRVRRDGTPVPGA